MFLKVHRRAKDGKDHRYYSLVESVRTSRGPQHRTLAYLGELNGSAEGAWRKSIAVFNGEGTETQLELFASDSPTISERGAGRAGPSGQSPLGASAGLWRGLPGPSPVEPARARHAARQADETGLESIPWPVMAFILSAARLIAPSSELAIEERFYPRTALEDICGVREEQVNKDRLYRALDHLLPHKASLEAHLKGRIGRLVEEPFDVLLYDLTARCSRVWARPIHRHAGASPRSSLRLRTGRDRLGGHPERATTRLRGLRRESIRPDDARRNDGEDGGAVREGLADLGVRPGIAARRTWRRCGARVGSTWSALRGPAAQGGEGGCSKSPGRRCARASRSNGWLLLTAAGLPHLCRSSDRQTKEAAIHDRFERQIEGRLARLEAARSRGPLHDRDVLRQRIAAGRSTCSRWRASAFPSMAMARR